MGWVEIFFRHFSPPSFPRQVRVPSTAATSRPSEVMAGLERIQSVISAFHRMLPFEASRQWTLRSAEPM